MDLALFMQMLEWDSTSGKERAFSDWLVSRLAGFGKLKHFEVGDGTENLLLSWGKPEVVFCTHMDTVPPYIAPQVVGGNTALPEQSAGGCSVAPQGHTSAGRKKAVGNIGPVGSTKPSPQSPDDVIFGRGACDAKGQIFAMLSACLSLASEGFDGFGLLLLSGEETGSWGAKAFAKTGFSAPFLIVGEPTENLLVSAAKGTKSYDLKFSGEAFHSGYPEYGVSAVTLFNEFCSTLGAVDFGNDPLLGATTWNIGLLRSDNPQNILSPELKCRLYFRTTFVSDEAVVNYMEGVGIGRKGIVTAGLQDRISVTARGGDAPQHYLVPEGFESAPVAFGSDAPHLSNFEHKIICGPGSIRHAHRSDEQISLPELEEAVKLYVRLFKHLYPWGTSA